MTDIALVDVDALLAPITADSPAGQDIGFSASYDAIREARRADDANLPQGEWQTELKVAEWPRVKSLSVEVLTSTSKDLQVACWLAEALVMLHGLDGLRVGLEVLTRLLRDYWPSLHPQIEDADLEIRANKLIWLNTHLAAAVRQIPLTSPASGGLSWNHWQETKELANLHLKNPQAAREAVEEGKVSAEQFERSVAETPVSFYTDLLARLPPCEGAYAALDEVVTSLFGADDAPTLADLRHALADCMELAGVLAEQKGASLPAAARRAGTAGGDVEPAAPAATRPVAARPPPADRSGPPQNREDALRRLNEVALFFKQTEPHSPVAYLVERAVKWGNMTLEQWLHEVIKDESVLTSLSDTLDLRPPAED